MFKFKLDFLLNYRRQKEEAAMFELARRIREANDIENEIEDLQVKSSQMIKAIREMGAAGVPAQIFTMYTNHRHHLHTQSERARKRLIRAEKLIDQQRQVLVAASQDRKSIERYRDKQQEAHNRAEALQEQNDLEELAALASTRRDRES